MSSATIWRGSGLTVYITLGLVSLTKCVSPTPKKRSKKSKKSVTLHKGHKTQFQDSSYTKISSSDFWDKTKCDTEFSYSTICGDFKFSQCHVGISKQLHVPEKNWKHKGVTGYSFVVFETVITNVSNSATEIQVPNLVTRRGDEILYFNPIIVWEDLGLHTGYKLNPEFYNRITIIYQIPEKYTQQFAFIYFENLFSIRGLKVDNTTIYKNDIIVIKNVK